MRRFALKMSGPTYGRRATWPSNVIRNRITKRKKRTLTTPAAATAIPVKPRTAASRATTKKIRAQRSMSIPPFWAGWARIRNDALWYASVQDQGTSNGGSFAEGGVEAPYSGRSMFWGGNVERKAGPRRKERSRDSQNIS